LLTKGESDTKDKILNQAADYFVQNLTYKSHNRMYAIVYLICEVLNLIVVLINFQFTNAFLGSNNFKNYGPDALSYSSHEDDPDSDVLSPMNIAFPKV